MRDAPPTDALPSLSSSLDDVTEVRRLCEAFREVYARLRDEIGRVIVGQDEIVEDVLVSLFAGGHVLLEGVPGLGKTLLVRTLASTLQLPFRRIQFTPDLMPADIVGTNIVVEDGAGGRVMTFRPGPIFCSILLADEINRATPKSQSALLEAMQECSVTVGSTTHTLDRPFLVLATQNPIEQEGTYTLPEAQLDRFLLKLTVPYTTRSELAEVLKRTTAKVDQTVRGLLDRERILAAQRLVRRIVAAPHVQDYAVRLVLATHHDGELATRMVKRYVSCGASPRGAQALILTAKVRAMIDGRYAIAYRDLRKSALPALRHRIIRNFEAEAEGVTTDDIIESIVTEVPTDMDA
ncbi:MAG: MoxR family ATPase [Phycisphaerales bacterium]|nr:MoxR family ATPase [Phycisphaerales bacterium]